mgnify:CR=1 FL=1
MWAKCRWKLYLTRLIIWIVWPALATAAILKRLSPTMSDQCTVETFWGAGSFSVRRSDYQSGRTLLPVLRFNAGSRTQVFWVKRTSAIWGWGWSYVWGGSTKDCRIKVTILLETYVWWHQFLHTWSEIAILAQSFLDIFLLQWNQILVGLDYLGDLSAEIVYHTSVLVDAHHFASKSIGVSICVSISFWSLIVFFKWWIMLSNLQFLFELWNIHGLKSDVFWAQTASWVCIVHLIRVDFLYWLWRTFNCHRFKDKVTFVDPAFIRWLMRNTFDRCHLGLDWSIFVKSLLNTLVNLLSSLDNS